MAQARLAHVMLADMLICPLCQNPLYQQQRAFRCGQGHHFDQAREGYLNLLPVQHKRSLQPGDNAAMMAARRQFFEQGYYLPLQQAIVKALAASTPEGSVLDLGCGEGYYTGALAEHFHSEALVSPVYGLDISKAAIQAAARRYKKPQFVVASSYKLPFAPAAFTGLLSVFAPFEPLEAARVLRPNGVLLRVLPAAEHLLQIKGLLYPEPRKHADLPEPLSGWRLLERQRVSTRFELDQQPALEALIAMTPYAWRLARVASEQLQAALPLQVSLDVWLEQWQPTSRFAETT